MLKPEAIPRRSSGIFGRGTRPQPALSRPLGAGLPHYAAGVPAFAAVVLMLVWAAHDGGFDADTWYWGALVSLSLVAASLTRFRAGTLRLTLATRCAIAALGLYVAWSYVSITWARSAGDALAGSNRALLYLLVFSIFALAPRSPRAALAILVAFAAGVGLIGAVILTDMATGHTATLFEGGRLISPTGYFNASAALFTVGAVLAIALSVRRELPALARGVLLALACAELQLALLAQSRGWLFTLPLVVLAAIAISPERIRFVIAGVLPAAGTLVVVSSLLRVFRAHADPSALLHAAEGAGRASLASIAAVLVVGSLIAAGEARIAIPRPRTTTRRLLGASVALLIIAAAGVGVQAATKGHPLRFLSRQWHGFTHPSPYKRTSSASHFGTVGSGRYDFWRVSIDAFVAHPIGGLGQDNFAEYYVAQRRTHEEPAWTHSLEMRLLAHTGLVGFVLFGAFLVTALAAALRPRRHADALTRGVAAAALLPLIVWLIHGSLDWFWEMPALTAPALGFLGLAGALAQPQGGEVRAGTRMQPGRTGRRVAAVAAALALLGGVIVLGFSYLSVREVSVASALDARSPATALSDLAVAAELNPLNADPGRIGGTIALRTGQFIEAESRFSQAISREPGGWFAWFGRGLAASALGDSSGAHHDFRVAAGINSLQPAVKRALAQVETTHPLTPAQGLRLLVLAR